MLYVKYSILYAAHSILTSKYQMKTFPKNQPSSLGCYFWEKEALFRTSHFSVFSAEPLYQNVRIDHRITLKMQNHCKPQVESWFGGFSLIWDFSVYFNYLSRIPFWGVGDHFQVLKVSEGTCTFRGGGPLPGP